MIRLSIWLALILTFVTTCLSRETLQIPDTGWRLLPDTAAAWQNDRIYLPEEVDLQKLPVNPPTGGWAVLNNAAGIEVKLPATLEQYFWRKFGWRRYHDEYYFENEDAQVKNGGYRGVSWWWREIEVPKSFRGKKVILHIRGARLRAEVYLNRRLVGYNIINETGFTCVVSEALRAGERNLLAIRITNPGGRFDWLDTKLMSWGERRFHASHGFGGLDRGLFFTAHDSCFIEDCWVLNTPQIRKIKGCVKIQNSSRRLLQGELRFEVRNPNHKNQVCSTTRRSVQIKPLGKIQIEEEIDYPEAKLWDLQHPELYRLMVTLKTKTERQRWKDQTGRLFGFRWFDVDGIGSDAVLRLNGKRIRLVSAISWGFWGLNGLWPTPELAEKEVLAAKTFGMNCIQFHRNIGKAEVLDAQDRLGLLRFMEPGGGQTAFGEAYSLYAKSPQDAIDTSGKNGDARTFAEKYMEEKIIRMVRDHRSHPSLVIYNIQNEIHPDLHNPRIFRILRRIHQEDPSRIVLLKSGIPPRNQAWMRPYDQTVYFDRGDGYSGWWDRHTVGGPGVWQDNMYQNPAAFTHRSENKKEIVVWGEMLGAAVPDNHAAMIREIQKSGGTSYDLKDHQEILQAYNRFLDRWKFRTAFPTAEALFTNIGDKCYDFWGRVIETARLAEANDFLVISGWESTAIENHSGLLDNLRGFKGNPGLLKKRLSPFRPVIKSRSLVIPVGSAAVLDLFMLNETGQAHRRTAALTLFDPSGNKKTLGTFPIPEWENDRFVYPIADSLVTPPLNTEGKYRLKLSVGNTASRAAEETLLVVNPFPESEIIYKVGALVHEPMFIRRLNAFPFVDAEPYRENGSYDVLLASTRLLYGWRSEVDPNREIAGTEDDFLYRTESWGYWKNLEYDFFNLPKGKAKVTLRFAEVTLKNPGDRIMNVAINGDTVLKDFDIVATVGGPNIALDTVFVVDAPEGTVKITVPKLTVNYAKFSAIKVEAGDSVIAINCGGKAYTDKNGLVWKPYRAALNLDESVLGKVRDGIPLLLLPDGAEAADAYGKALGKAGTFQYLGHVGNVRASWMGAWFFVRAHPVFAGLPVNRALKSYYQVPVSGSDGLLLGGENVEVFVGYGRDHDRNIGAAAFTARLGKGKILFFTLPGMVRNPNGKQAGIHPVILKRLLSNSIRYLCGE